jgi:hypothetical protein
MAVWGLGAQAVILQHRTYLVTAGMAESGHKPSSIGYSPRGCTIRLFVFLFFVLWNPMGLTWPGSLTESI